MIALVGAFDPLTAHVANALRAAGRAPLLCLLSARPAPAGDREDVLRFRPEHLGTLLQRLRDRGVEEVCFVGAVQRPRLDPAQLDEATKPLVPLILGALQKGDDGALRVLLRVFEERGFRVRAAQELAPDLLPPPGPLSAARPSPRQEADARRAEEVHRLLAPADIGQGVVVKDGQVVAVEAAPGTDFMLRTVQGHADGALFLKAPKRGQDRRVDLPVIGTHTIEAAREARLGAVVVEAGGVIVLRREACAQLADAAGLVLWVREPAP